MAKKIRFPLKMNGADVRTIEELKENFDLESVLGYFANGKLVTWLKDRYYDNEAMAVEALNVDDKDLNQKLMSILGVSIDSEIEEIDMEAIQRRNEKLMLLRQITDDKEIIDNVDCVAFNQDDLLDILDEGTEKIYLCQGEFDVPLTVKNIMYIGVNNPIILLRAYDNVNFGSLNIKFVNACFGWDISSTTNKDRLYQAEKLMEQSKFDNAISILEVLTEEKNPRAYSILALIYEKVYVSTQNKDKAQKLRNQSAEIGNVFDWIETNKEFSEYKRLLRKMVNKGDKTAMGYLGFLYSIENDIDNAFKYLELGAVKNDIISCGALYYLYMDNFVGGKIPEKYVDTKKALVYGKKAALLGDTDMAIKLGDIYYSGISGQVEVDFKSAAKMYTIAASNESSLAQYDLGALYEQGLGVDKDYTKAAYWFEKSSNAGNSSAMFELGKCFEKGWGVNQNYNKAFEWYEKSANLGNMYAQNDLGFLYQTGQGVAKDFNLALYWYQKSAEQGLQTAKENVEYIKNEINRFKIDLSPADKLRAEQKKLRKELRDELKNNILG